MTAVFLDYDQATLDAQYDQATLVPDLSAYRARWNAGCVAARARFDVLADVPYGPTPAERLDVFRAPGAAGRPIHLFFHGGAWRQLGKADAAFIAPTVVEAGATFVSVGFALVPAVPLAEQVRQARAALAFVAANAAALGGNPNQISVSGHSSGAHLVGCLLADGWHDAFDTRPDAIRAAVAVSGIYDLEPVRLSARNRYLALDGADVALLSPIRHVPSRTEVQLSVLWGEKELDEFRRQSESFATALRSTGHSVDAREVAGANHFDVFDAFGDHTSIVGQAIVAALSK